MPKVPSVKQTVPALRDAELAQLLEVARRANESVKSGDPAASAGRYHPLPEQAAKR
jgi:hypothetical protein